MNSFPSKVLIAGGKPNGGVASFAEALRFGFTELGMEAEVAPPTDVLTRVRELRDPSILKLLSLAAWFGAPIARRAFCMAHGFPCVSTQGWVKMLGILAAVHLGSASRGVQVIEVSQYSALHIQEIFGIRVDAVIRNPVHPLFLEPPGTSQPRFAITYVGRLHRSKYVDRLLPAMHDVLDESPELQAWIIGDGALRPELERMVAGDERFRFFGALPPIEVREKLRATKVFISGNPTEPFGIVYLEALSQDCAVAMPACGGGLEIAPDLIGNRIQLFPTSMDRRGIISALRKALIAPPKPTDLTCYSARVVAEAYLAVDARFSKKGIFCAEVDQ